MRSSTSSSRSSTSAEHRSSTRSGRRWTPTTRRFAASRRTPRRAGALASTAIARSGWPDMARLIARRLAAGVVIVWLVSVLVFLATQLLPGGAASELLGRQGTPEAVAALQKQLHLNDPVFAQYWHWLRDLVTGQWGNSLVSQDSVAHIVGTGIENTGLVMLLTMLVATPIAVWLGVVSALHSEGWLDHVLSVVTPVLLGPPAFVIALALIFLFATNVPHVLPAASLVNPDESIFSQLNL